MDEHTLHLDQIDPPKELIRFDTIERVDDLPESGWTKKFWKFERWAGKSFICPSTP